MDCDAMVPICTHAGYERHGGEDTVRDFLALCDTYQVQKRPSKLTMGPVMVDILPTPTLTGSATVIDSLPCRRWYSHHLKRITTGLQARSRFYTRKILRHPERFIPKLWASRWELFYTAGYCDLCVVIHPSLRGDISVCWHCLAGAGR